MFWVLNLGLLDVKFMFLVYLRFFLIFVRDVLFFLFERRDEIVLVIRGVVFMFFNYKKMEV